MKKIVFLLLVFSVCLTGCGRVSESALSGVLEKDPSFRKVLDKKENISAKILKLNASYKKEKDVTIKSIYALKEGLRTKKDNLKTRIAGLGKELGPEIDLLKKKLDGKTSEYKLKRKTLKEARAKLKNIRKLLKKKSDYSLSGEEISVWNKKAAALEKKIARVNKDLDELRSKIRLLRTEIKILKE